MSYAKVCAQCERSFVSRRPDAETCTEECKYQNWIERGVRDAQPVTHPLDDARGKMREGRTSAQWELVAREKVARTLLDTGEFTADDLADLNIPVDYRRHIHGAATGYFAGAEPFMDFIGRQKSARPSRKGAKNDLYAINAKGRRELPKLLRDLQRELPKLVGLSNGSSGHVAPVAQSGENENVGFSAAAQPDPSLGGPAGSGRSIEPGDSNIGAGQVSGKRDQGGSHSSPVAGTDAPDLLQLDVPRESGSSAYDAWEAA